MTFAAPACKTLSEQRDLQLAGKSLEKYLETESEAHKAKTRPNADKAGEEGASNHRQELGNYLY
ncbi:MAG: hypothetical protein ABI995_04860 [Acidobacteriota bacterium]